MTLRWFVAAALVMGTAGTGNAERTPKPATPKADAKGKPEAKPTPEAEPAIETPTGAPADQEILPDEQDPILAMPHITGPKLVNLGHDAEIDLPAGMILLERAASVELMKQWGNDYASIVAVVLPPRGTATWSIVIDAADIGYISDDDADELDPDPLMKSIKDGTLEQNKERKKLGVPELFIDGWSEKPRYERLQHHLVWGINGHDTDGKVVNFFTRFLGRNGMLSVNLIDAPDTIEASKKDALAVLNVLRFRPGARYSDHVDGDKDSGIGLRALVLGGAGLAIAKKGGFLVALILFLKKGFVVIAAAFAGFFKWMFGRKRKTDGTPPSEPPPPAPPESAPVG